LASQSVVPVRSFETLICGLFGDGIQLRSGLVVVLDQIAEDPRVGGDGGGDILKRKSPTAKLGLPIDSMGYVAAVGLISADRGEQ
jgi:hypothetical protein